MTTLDLPATPAVGVKQRTWEILRTARSGDRASRAFDIALITLICLNVVAVVVGTVESVGRVAGPALAAFELFSVTIFTAEYLLRLWSCTAEPCLEAAGLHVASGPRGDHAGGTVPTCHDPRAAVFRDNPAALFLIAAGT